MASPLTVSARAGLVRTGVPGLDALLAGGLPRGRCVLVYGDPGSGKTTLAFQYLHQGVVEFEEKGLYVTLTEDPAEIRSNMKNFGWDAAKLEREKKLTFLDARPVVANDEGFISPVESLFKGEVLPFSHVGKLIIDRIKRLGAKRVVVDSITVLTMQYVNRFYIRQGLLGFIQALTTRDCTSMLLVEAIKDEKNAPLEFALAPGVISVRYTRKGDGMVRSVQVQKMRGLKHKEQIYHMEINESGVVVNPEVRVVI
ncbi:MAG: RAD55 family ATPase [Candidatus Bathyarchaeia archaeon]